MLQPELVLRCQFAEVRGKLEPKCQEHGLEQPEWGAHLSARDGLHWEKTSEESHQQGTQRAEGGSQGTGCSAGPRKEQKGCAPAAGLSGGGGGLPELGRAWKVPEC